MNERKASTTSRRRYIPEDLIIDIQRRLRPSSIPRFYCVSKSWNSILSNPSFFYKNLFDDDENKVDPNTQILIATSRDNPSEYTCHSYDSLFPLLNTQSLRKFPNKPPGYDHPLNSLWWIGSCHGGFVCLVYVKPGCLSASMCLFNPATGETKMLPPLPGPNNMFGIVSVGSALVEEDVQQYHYKVVTLIRCGGLNAYVFSSDDESQGWKKLPSLDPQLQLWRDEIPQYGCTWKKKCYWMAYHFKTKKITSQVVSFDLSTEVFRVRGTFIDKKSPFCSTAYMVKDETLVVFDSAVEVWVLQRSEVGESWCKLFVIDFPDHTRIGLSLNPMRSVIGLLKHGHVVYMVYGGTSLQILDVTTGQTSSVPFTVPDLHLGESAEIHHLTTYVPTKMSLSK
ncbi:Probable F-box protein At5g47300 [Linum grandiflorum]